MAGQGSEGICGHVYARLHRAQRRVVSLLRALPALPFSRLQLTPEEQHFLDTASTEVKRQFEAADKAIGEAAVLSMAGGAGARGR